MNLTAYIVWISKNSYKEKKYLPIVGGKALFQNNLWH